MRSITIGGLTVSAVTLRFFLVTLILAGVALYWATLYRRDAEDQKAAQSAAQTNARALADSGSDFVIHNNIDNINIPVSSKLDGAGPPQVEMHRGDSLVLVFRLKSRDAGGSGAAESGNLTPMLTVADCAVTAQTAALTKATTQPLAAFVWQWSIDDCKSTGFKAVQMLLVCGPQCSDPVADRQLAFIHVTDPFAWTDALPILAVVTGLLTIVNSVTGLFDGHRAGT